MHFWFISVHHGLYANSQRGLLDKCVSGSLMLSMVYVTNSQHGLRDKCVFGSLLFSLIVATKSIKYKSEPIFQFVLALTEKTRYFS